eukprot:UC4_evm4s1361
MFIRRPTVESVSISDDNDDVITTINESRDDVGACDGTGGKNAPELGPPPLNGYDRKAMLKAFRFSSYKRSDLKSEISFLKTNREDGQPEKDKKPASSPEDAPVDPAEYRRQISTKSRDKHSHLGVYNDPTDVQPGFGPFKDDFHESDRIRQRLKDAECRVANVRAGVSFENLWANQKLKRRLAKNPPEERTKMQLDMNSLEDIEEALKSEADQRKKKRQEVQERAESAKTVEMKGGLPGVGASRGENITVNEGLGVGFNDIIGNDTLAKGLSVTCDDQSNPLGSIPGASNLEKSLPPEDQLCSSETKSRQSNTLEESVCEMQLYRLSSIKSIKNFFQSPESLNSHGWMSRYCCVYPSGKITISLNKEAHEKGMFVGMRNILDISDLVIANENSENSDQVLKGPSTDEKCYFRIDFDTVKAEITKGAYVSFLQDRQQVLSTMSSHNLTWEPWMEPLLSRSHKVVKLKIYDEDEKFQNGTWEKKKTVFLRVQRSKENIVVEFPISVVKINRPENTSFSEFFCTQSIEEANTFIEAIETVHSNVLKENKLRSLPFQPKLAHNESKTGSLLRNMNLLPPNFLLASEIINEKGSTRKEKINELYELYFILNMMVRDAAEYPSYKLQLEIKTPAKTSSHVAANAVDYELSGKSSRHPISTQQLEIFKTLKTLKLIKAADDLTQYTDHLHSRHKEENDTFTKTNSTTQEGSTATVRKLQSYLPGEQDTGISRQLGKKKSAVASNVISKAWSGMGQLATEFNKEQIGALYDETRIQVRDKEWEEWLSEDVRSSGPSLHGMKPGRQKRLLSNLFSSRSRGHNHAPKHDVGHNMSSRTHGPSHQGFPGIDSPAFWNPTGDMPDEDMLAKYNQVNGDYLESYLPGYKIPDNSQYQEPVMKPLFQTRAAHACTANLKNFKTPQRLWELWPLDSPQPLEVEGGITVKISLQLADQLNKALQNIGGTTQVRDRFRNKFCEKRKQLSSALRDEFEGKDKLRDITFKEKLISIRHIGKIEPKQQSVKAHEKCIKEYRDELSKKREQGLIGVSDEDYRLLNEIFNKDVNRKLQETQQDYTFFLRHLHLAGSADIQLVSDLKRMAENAEERRKLDANDEDQDARMGWYRTIEDEVGDFKRDKAMTRIMNMLKRMTDESNYRQLTKERLKRVLVSVPTHELAKRAFQ